MYANWSAIGGRFVRIYILCESETPNGHPTGPGGGRGDSGIPPIVMVRFSGGERRAWMQSEYPAKGTTSHGWLKSLVTPSGGLGCRNLGVCDRAGEGRF